MTLERGAGEAQTRPPAPVSRPENLPEPQTLAPHNTRNGASFRVARTKVSRADVLALVVFAIVGAVFCAILCSDHSPSWQYVTGVCVFALAMMAAEAGR